MATRAEVRHETRAVESSRVESLSIGGRLAAAAVDGRRVAVDRLRWSLFACPLVCSEWMRVRVTSGWMSGHDSRVVAVAAAAAVLLSLCERSDWTALSVRLVRLAVRQQHSQTARQ